MKGKEDGTQPNISARAGRPLFVVMHSGILRRNSPGLEKYP